MKLQMLINELSDTNGECFLFKKKHRTQAMLELLITAKKAAIPARYVLFDNWFSSPSTLHTVKSTGYDVIGMVKKTPKMFFRYNGEDMFLITIYNQNKKRRGRSRYLLSVLVDGCKG